MSPPPETKRRVRDPEAKRAAILAAAYRTVLTGDDVDIRVDLVGSLLIGVTLSRYVLAEGPLSTMPPDGLVRYLTKALGAILLS